MELMLKMTNQAVEKKVCKYVSVKQGLSQLESLVNFLFNKIVYGQSKKTLSGANHCKKTKQKSPGY